MINRTAKLTILILGIWAMLGALGCSGGESPVIPGAEDQLATSDYTDETTLNDEERQVAEGTYSGVLTDSSGDPLAWTELYLDGEIAGWTEEDGSFTIYGIDELAEYTLEAQIDGEVIYTTVLTPALRTAQALTDDDPDIDRGTVWGFVHDQLGPVDHALVVVFNQSENFGADFTDENGRYEIPDAPAGPGIIIGFAPHHATAHDQVFVIPDGEVQKNLFLPAQLNFGMVGGIVITGPPGNFKPIRHARVDVDPVNAPDDAPEIVAFTNMHGVYVAGPVPLGPATLEANAPCLNTGFQGKLIHPGRNFASFHLEPQGCGGVEGQVTNPAGEVIPQALVKVVRELPNGEIWQRWTFTNPMGLYRIAPLLPGEYQLISQKPGYQPFHQPVPIFPDQFTVVDIVLIPVDDGDPGG